MRRGPKPAGISPAEKKRRQRLCMDRLRATRKQIWRCRQCPKPAKMHPDTGRPMSMCEDHLKYDNERAKAKYKKRGTRG